MDEAIPDTQLQVQLIVQLQSCTAVPYVWWRPRGSPRMRARRVARTRGAAAPRARSVCAV